jgi:hypothetical protein
VPKPACPSCTGPMACLPALDVLSCLGCGRRLTMEEAYLMEHPRVDPRPPAVNTWPALKGDLLRDAGLGWLL